MTRKSGLYVTNALGRFSCHGRKSSQTIFTIEILIKILAASACTIDFFCNSVAVSNFCDERKSALGHLYEAPFKFVLVNKLLMLRMIH